MPNRRTIINWPNEVEEQKGKRRRRNGGIGGKFTIKRERILGENTCAIWWRSK
jgi:hypothetical protein